VQQCFLVDSELVAVDSELRELCAREAVAVVLRVEVGVRPSWDNPERVEVGVRAVVVEFDVLHVDRLGHVRELVDVARVLQAKVITTTISP
jgi:hypothetical protein